MAKINLLPRKEFEIVLESGETIKGRFGTWAHKRFGILKGFDLDKISDYLKNANPADYIGEFILCAVEYSTRLEFKDFKYTDVHAWLWIDEIGTESEEFKQLLTHANTEEKKTESRQNGLPSKQSALLPE